MEAPGFSQGEETKTLIGERFGSIIPLAGSRFEWERLNPYTQDCSLVRKVVE
jgi:hypothetical protein